MAKNVIIMVGDSMGCKMSCAAGIHKQINEDITGLDVNNSIVFT